MKFFKDCLIGGAISLVGWIVLISLIVLLINNIEELSIMNKLEITKKIVSLVNIKTEEAQTTIINAVATWGLLKSENFVELFSERRN
ncbi:hypothetical protein ACT7C2_01470 [Bacillus pacificus]